MCFIPSSSLIISYHIWTKDRGFIFLLLSFLFPVCEFIWGFFVLVFFCPLIKSISSDFFCSFFLVCQSKAGVLMTGIDPTEQRLLFNVRLLRGIHPSLRGQINVFNMSLTSSIYIMVDLFQLWSGSQGIRVAVRVGIKWRILSRANPYQRLESTPSSERRCWSDL